MSEVPAQSTRMTLLDTPATSYSSVTTTGLRDYQKAAIDWLLEHRRGYLCADRGTGKTVIALTAARELVPHGPILVLCPKVALGVWAQEAKRWLDEDVVLYTGPIVKRGKLGINSGRIVVAPYSLARELSERRDGKYWQLRILDEAHLLRNRQTQMFRSTESIYAAHTFGLSGSPIVRSGLDLWAPLHLCWPQDGEFAHYWPFVNRHFAVHRGRFGTEILGLKNQPAFRTLIQRYALRFRLEQVLPELPEKIRQLIPIEMTKEQRRIYEELSGQMIAEVGEDGHLVLVPNTMTKILRLRQLLVTPALLGGTHQSGVFQALEESIQLDFGAGDSVMVFTPFNGAIPFVQELCQRIAAKCYVLTGGLASKRITQIIDTFQKDTDPRKVLCCQIMVASSFTATAANRSYFLGYDWNPMINWQAEDRTRRLSQTKTCTMTYFTYNSTIDVHMREILDGKDQADKICLALAAKDLLQPAGVVSR
jgi:SNF2 family DNA or RNA helicase